MKEKIKKIWVWTVVITYPLLIVIMLLLFIMVAHVMAVGYSITGGVQPFP